MKIECLDLKAFGHFTDASLDFTQADHGLYVVYGPNEAGKSTALKGIRQWLYEFDPRQSINHVHKNAVQRVGGILSAGEQRLECLRKRGQKGTLLASDGKTALPDTVLLPLLQGIDEKRFSATFGIDHEQLVQGGRDIAAGRGDLGQALFSAGSGLINLRRIQTGLEAEAKKLYVLRGQHPAINACLARCSDLEKKLGESQLSVAVFEEQEARLRAAEEERRRLLDAQLALERQREELTRLAQARQPAARRVALLDRLRDLETAVPLREEFPQEFHEADGKCKAEQGTLREQLEEAGIARTGAAGAPHGTCHPA